MEDFASWVVKLLAQDQRRRLFLEIFHFIFVAGVTYAFTATAITSLAPTTEKVTEPKPVKIIMPYRKS